jgi:hypothetical protein
MTSTQDVAVEWTLLAAHFQHHASVIDRFRHTCPATVMHMIKSGTNEAGAVLSPFERMALNERHCELFGCWPPEAICRSANAL